MTSRDAISNIHFANCIYTGSILILQAIFARQLVCITSLSTVLRAPTSLLHLHLAWRAVLQHNFRMSKSSSSHRCMNNGAHGCWTPSVARAPHLAWRTVSQHNFRTSKSSSSHRCMNNGARGCWTPSVARASHL